jgi:sucrose phosphorylase
MIKNLSSEQLKKIERRFNRLYGPARSSLCLERLAMLIGRYGIGYNSIEKGILWDESRILLITYADTLTDESQAPLEVLKQFADQYLHDVVDTIHILPFFPYSSDDGFSIIDYRKVNPAVGKWEHVEQLKSNFNLMFDLVLNHVSRQSSWFRLYVDGEAPYRDYFIEMDPSTDVSSVIRPRTSPLLTAIHKSDSNAYVWTTFSEDQIDLDFSNPDVLFDFLDVLFFYVAHGADMIRLDAIAYLWKQVGTSCIHLPQTHEVVKLFRDLLDMVAPSVILLTETNVPHEENISYFGDGDEAHMIYQFSLPPLLLHALISENTSILTNWAKTVCTVPDNCTYLNFTASHDGIGVRPLSGLVPSGEFEQLVDHVKAQGGHVSCKKNSDGTESPYELNITYFDALGGDDFQVDRFLCSQSVMIALKGVPAIYIHSLLATPNDTDGVKRTGHKRSINRKKIPLNEVEISLREKVSDARVFHEYRRRLQIRIKHAAFHPDASQEILTLDQSVFGFVRTAQNGSEQIAVICNFSSKEKVFPVDKSIPHFKQSTRCTDLLTGTRISGEKSVITLTPFQTVWLSKE